MTYYLAVDIGASSGRHILGWIRDGKIELEEIRRFPNEMIRKNGSLCWDLEALFREITLGLKRAKEIGKIPASMGIDTWGVDYALLDGDGRTIGNTYGYRDKRTNGMEKIVYNKISPFDLYDRTGIQFQKFNTIFQLMALKEQEPEILEKAKSLLMIPDYFHYRLTGIKSNEYTNATTTQLVNAETGAWDNEILDDVGIDRGLFQPLSLPGTELGNFLREIREEVGFDCRVVLPPTHDTASAVLAAPMLNRNALYISSGTWSLMGCELPKANLSAESMAANFTNEGGYNRRFRFLKNIMGLWMIQSVRKELNNNYSFDELCKAAREESLGIILDCDDPRFLAPDSMIKAIQDYCVEKDMPVPQTPGELSAAIYDSLAHSYAKTAREIENAAGQRFDCINIIGGGSKNAYLNELTAKAIGKPVYAGPTEATAIGNILAQMICAGEFSSVKEARECVGRSFNIEIY